MEPINAEEFRWLILHPLLRQHKPHLKIIVGGPGAWQIERKGLQDEWLIDCIFGGEAEEGVAELFESAIRGEPIPRRVEGHSPRLESIPPLRHRSTFGAVEITRGCGRGCQFCSVALRAGKSFPLEQITANVRTQAAEGAEFALLVTEDLFLYEHGPRFGVNIPDSRPQAPVRIGSGRRRHQVYRPDARHYGAHRRRTQLDRRTPIGRGAESFCASHLYASGKALPKPVHRNRNRPACSRSS